MIAAGLTSRILRAAVGLLLGASLLNAAEQRSIPRLATIAGIQVGHTTLQDLEARWGAGKPITGGHPNGARLWRVKGTSWVIWADAFDYSERGIVVDSFSLDARDARAADAPFANVSSKALAYFHSISVGMTEAEVLATLRRNHLALKKTATGWKSSAKGFEPLVSIQGFHTWTVQFEFKGGVLKSLSLDAS